MGTLRQDDELRTIIGELRRPAISLDDSQRATLSRRALSLIDRDHRPELWGILQIELARSLSKNVETLREATEAYHYALEVLTREQQPLEWALAQLGLARVYAEGDQGDGGENLERSIEAYVNALTVLTREGHPMQWAEIMKALAGLYAERIRGNRGENLERSIEAYVNALTVLTREGHPMQWAEIMKALAGLYAERIRGNRGENLSRAIEAYHQALQLLTRERQPLEWALAQLGLARVYAQTGSESEAESLDRSVQAYGNAVTIITRENYPIPWAEIMGELGAIYARRSRGDPDSNLNAAVGAFQGALAILQPDEPSKRGHVLTQMADVLFSRERWIQAAAAYEQALAAGSLQFAGLANLAYALAKQGDVANAVLSIEQGAATFARQLSGNEGGAGNQLSSITQLQSTLDGPLIYVLTTRFGGLSLIVESSTISARWLDTSSEAIDKILLGRANPDSAREGYIDALARWRTNFLPFQSLNENGRLQAPDAWASTLDETARRLWNMFIEDWLQIVSSYTNVTLIPIGPVGLLPLHAAWIADHRLPTGRRYFIDTAVVHYAPSALSSSKSSRAEQLDTNNILVVHQPQSDYTRFQIHSDLQALTVAEAFSRSRILDGRLATKAAILSELKGCSVLHFAGYGYDNPDQPLESGLVAASNEMVTIRDFFKLRNDGLRLAVLSGLDGPTPRYSQNQGHGLAFNLLLAGITGVVAPMWLVNELSATLLLTRFYECWRVHGLPPAVALRQAQLWLRDLTNEEALQHLGASFAEHKDAFKNLSETPSSRSFAHPFYWAGFRFIGA
jgi:CHAT domain-containing protein/tetratricopeptide (TPR) repeat protein